MVIVLPACPKQAAETSVPVSGPAQVPQALHWGGGCGRASGDGSVASLAGRLHEGWCWGCAGALQAPPSDIAKSKVGIPPPNAALGGHM